MNIDTRRDELFYHLSDCPDDRVKEVAARCVAAQCAAVNNSKDPMECSASSIEAAKLAVSAATLEQILSSGSDIHGISTNDEISNVIAFNTSHLQNSVRNDAVADLRAQLDREVIAMLRQLVAGFDKMQIAGSGHFWYPAGSYMGWHTNNKAPGWRVYLTHTSQSGSSFFRYRDPRSGKIETSEDNRWDLRIFRVDPRAPLWHAVYSETDRFSFGYALVEPSLPSRAKSFIKRSLGISSR